METKTTKDPEKELETARDNIAASLRARGWMVEAAEESRRSFGLPALFASVFVLWDLGPNAPKFGARADTPAIGLKLKVSFNHPAEKRPVYIKYELGKSVAKLDTMFRERIEEVKKAHAVIDYRSVVATSICARLVNSPMLKDKAIRIRRSWFDGIADTNNRVVSVEFRAEGLELLRVRAYQQNDEAPVEIQSLEIRPVRALNAGDLSGLLGQLLGA